MLGATGAPLAAPLLARLDEIASDAAAAEDAEDDGGAGDLAAARRGAEGALGAAVRSLGPEAVLDTLPLRLEEVCPHTLQWPGCQHYGIKASSPPCAPVLMTFELRCEATFGS